MRAFLRCLYFLLVVSFRFVDFLDCDILFAQWTGCMIFEPVFDASMVKVVLEVTRKHNDCLFWLKLAKTDAALLLIGEYLIVPL